MDYRGEGAAPSPHLEVIDIMRTLLNVCPPEALRPLPPTGRGYALSFLAIAGFFAAAALLLFPLQHIFQFDPSEGYNLIQSLLYLKDYSLYDQILSDQPPLGAFLLTSWIQAFGASVYGLRIFMLLFSALLLWAVYLCVRLHRGPVYGAAASVLLAFSYNYLRLSSSVMTDIPALAFAALAVYFAHLFKASRREGPLFASGALMAMAAHCKFITAALAPLILLDLLTLGLQEPQDRERSYFPLAAALWAAAFLGAYLGVLIFFLPENIDLLLQFFSPQVLGLEKQPRLGPETVSTLKRWFRKDYEMIIMALAGMFHIVSRNRRQEIFYAAWFLLFFTIILFLQRLSYSHYMLISAPLAVLAAIGLGESFRLVRVLIARGGLRDVSVSGKVACAVALWATVFFLAKMPGKLHSFYEKCTEYLVRDEDRRLMDLVERFAPYSEWMLTNSQIHAFQAGLKIPPELAGGGEGRLASLPASQCDWLDALDNYRPGIVLLVGLDYNDPELMARLYDDYLPLSESSLLLFFVRRDIAEKAAG